MKTELEYSHAWEIVGKTAKFVLAGKENPIYSPVCIQEGLRAMRLGAAGDTATELAELVGTDALGEDPYGLEASSLLAYGGYSAHIAAGIWLDEKAKPQDSFLKACSQEGVECRELPFSDPSSSSEISEWIAAKTEGLLKPSISLDPLSLACIVSALYFKDAWESKFPKEKTEKGEFHGMHGTAEADFMVGEDELKTADFDFGTVVERPLSNGGSMLLVLPNEGTGLEGLLESDSLIEELSAFEAETINVELHMPKYTCELTIDNLSGALARAGFSSAASPNLEPMVGLERTIASYIHGAKISVDEEGLEAGAYFAMVVCAGLPTHNQEPPAPRVIELNRPFLYAVLSKTRQPLFVGAVTNPGTDMYTWAPLPLTDEKGSEGGWVILDEEIPGICRITLEDDCPIGPYGITCGIYGWLVHTTWASEYEEAMLKYDGMKKDLRNYAETCDEDDFSFSKWAHEFTNKW